MWTEQERDVRLDAEWRPRVFKGALLLDELMPEWEHKINVQSFDMGQRGQDIVSQLWHVEERQMAFPLVFAGKGLEGSCGQRPQPGPPPPLHSNEATDIWKYTVSGAHWVAAKDHGFTSGAPKYWDYISSDKLTCLWLELIMQRGIGRLQS